MCVCVCVPIHYYYYYCYECVPKFCVCELDEERNHRNVNRFYLLCVNAF